jgi:hypothetical protein
MYARHGHPRGLADLNTLSRLSAHEIAPHTAYMKITSLELEKVRLGRVRRNALRRIAEIDARYQDIHAEKARLLDAIAGAATPAQPRSEPPRLARGFNPRHARGPSLRY